jgi:uncharacterized membrane protein
MINACQQASTRSITIVNKKRTIAGFLLPSDNIQLAFQFVSCLNTSKESNTRNMRFST